MKLEEKLVSLRKAKGLSQMKLAEMMNVTTFNNGSTRYEYYCSASEKIYSFYDEALDENVYTADTSNENVEVTVFDVAKYRENNTEKHELSDEEEQEIRSIMMQEESIEGCQEQLEAAGIENVVVSEKNGVKVASVDVNSIANTRAANATTSAVVSYGMYDAGYDGRIV